MATTDAAGHYRLSVLPPGLYEVTFTLAGFAIRVEEGHLGRPRQGDDARRDPAPGGERGDRRQRRGARRRHDFDDSRREFFAAIDPDAPDGAQLFFDRPGDPGHVLRRGLAQHDAVDDHRLRLLRRRERLLHRRREHDRCRVRLSGKEPQLRVRPGGQRPDGRLRGGVRPLDGRHRQRHHQVGRQRIPRRRLRLLQQRFAPGDFRSRSSRRPARSRVSPGRTSGRIWAATSGRTGSGSSAPTTGSTTRPTTSSPTTPTRTTRSSCASESKSSVDLASAKLTFAITPSQNVIAHLHPGSPRRHRGDQRRRSHAERRSLDVRRRAGLRRAGLFRALSGDLRTGLGRDRAVGAPSGKEQRWPRDGGRRRHPVPGRREQLLPDRRLRPHSGEGLQEGLLRRRLSRATSSSTRSSSASSTRRRKPTS